MSEIRTRAPEEGAHLLPTLTRPWPDRSGDDKGVIHPAGTRLTTFYAGVAPATSGGKIDKDAPVWVDGERLAQLLRDGIAVMPEEPKKTEEPKKAQEESEKPHEQQDEPAAGSPEAPPAADPFVFDSHRGGKR